MLIMTPINNITYTQCANINKDQNMSAVSFSGAVKDVEPKRIWELLDEISKIYRESTDPNNPETKDNLKEISNWVSNKLSNLKGDLKFNVFQDPGYTPEERLQKLKELDLEATDKIGDKKYNIIATRNVKKDTKNLIILQAHLDMVCVSDNKDPRKKIEFRKDGNWVKANNRTAGFDNGYGLAQAIAIAENPKFKDIPLVILATADEETGTWGAKGITAKQLMGINNKEQNPLVGKNIKLINIDSEEIGLVVVGCSGLQKFVEAKNVDMVSIEKPDYKKVSISMENGSGGHSGVDINLGRINTIKETISMLETLPDARLISMEAGEKFNSIPRDMKVEFLIPNSYSNKDLNNLISDIKSKYKETDPKLDIKMNIVDENVSPKTLVLEKDFQDKMFSIIGGKKANTGKCTGLDSGAISVYDNGTTKTSQNVGIINLKNGNLSLTVSMRSSDKKEEAQLYKKTTELLAKLFDKKEVKACNNSPMWEPVNNSLLEKLAVASYKELQTSPETKQLFSNALDSALKAEDNPIRKKEREENAVRSVTCHGGLEPADFAETISQYNKEYPENAINLEQISVGPEIKYPHSTDEKVSIPSVELINEFLNKLLDKLKTFIQK